MNYEIVDQHLVVKLSGELDHHVSESLRKKIDQYYLSKKLSNIVLDLRDLNFMDSSGIGLIMGRYKMCKEHKGDLSIVSTSPYINRILKMSGIYKIINVFSTVDEAIKG
jgi:stage II sporulation protein AA (anti-sigma F factor antagonist)